jgi:hypothetical protein
MIKKIVLSFMLDSSDPRPRADNDPLPCLPKQTVDKTTYLNKWGAASMTP